MPVLAGGDLVITLGLQDLAVLPGFEMYPKRPKKRLVLVAVTDKHPVAWHLSVSLLRLLVNLVATGRDAFEQIRN
jgi:hypothetical protein